VGSFLAVTSDDFQAFERKTDGVRGKTADRIRLIEPEVDPHNRVCSLL
jgi:hypothetical protein